MSLFSFIRVAGATLICTYALLPLTVYADNDVGIEVSGQGSVVVIPDQFSLTLTISERGRVPSKLKALVDKKSNSVINTAKNLAIKENHITSARVNLRIIEEKPSIEVQGLEYNKIKQGSVFVDGQSMNQQITPNNQHKKTLFELSRQITVNFSDIEQYDSFLAQVINISVSHISALSMSVAGREEYYQQALLQAISHAQQKAQRMSKQAGRHLGELILIKELSSNHYRPMYAKAMMSDSSPAEHNSLIGDQTITARVLVEFSFKD